MRGGLRALLCVTALLVSEGFAAPRGAETTTVRILYPSGRLRRTETAASYRRTTVREWYEGGQPMREYHYASGLSEGVQRQWYPSGQVFTLFHHRSGHEDGQQQMWNSDGTIRSNYVIRDGKRYGLLGAMGCTGKRKGAAEDSL